MSPLLLSITSPLLLQYWLNCYNSDDFPLVICSILVICWRVGLPVELHSVHHLCPKSSWETWCPEQRQWKVKSNGSKCKHKVYTLALNGNRFSKLNQKMTICFSCGLGFLLKNKGLIYTIKEALQPKDIKYSSVLLTCWQEFPKINLTEGNAV